ncbi:MAG: guanylate kinase, partial [Bacilli bacterium]|nr:guanylate kinase [Bacilli bacterium]
MAHNNAMILLIGASASGKTEIAKALFRLHGIKKAVTHTSRPIRPSETPDVDYHFVTEEKFLRLKEEGEFVETTDYNGK